MEQLLGLSDFIFGNEDEVAHFAKVHDLIKTHENTEECYFDICNKLEKKFKSHK